MPTPAKPPSVRDRLVGLYEGLRDFDRAAGSRFLRDLVATAAQISDAPQTLGQEALRATAPGYLDITINDPVTGEPKFHEERGGVGPTRQRAIDFLEEYKPGRRTLEQIDSRMAAPEGPAQILGDAVGRGAAAAVPFIAGGALAARRPPTGTATDRILAEPYRTQPGRTAAIELASGATGGAVGEVASRTPWGREHPVASRLLGEIAGGLAGGAAASRVTRPRVQAAPPQKAAEAVIAEDVAASGGPPVAEPKPAQPPGIRVQRAERAGHEPSFDKPEGLYVAPGEVDSPHMEDGRVRIDYEIRGDAKTLDLTHVRGEDVVMRRGANDAGVGVAAARELLGGEEFERIRRLSKRDLLEYARARFPDVSFRDNYADAQEVMEAIGGAEARSRGYDVIYRDDRILPHFAEYSILNESAASRVDNAKPPAFEPVSSEQGQQMLGEMDSGTVRRLDPELHKRATAAFTDLLKEGEVTLRPGARIHTQVAELMATGRVNDDLLNDVLRRNNMTPDEFAKVMDHSIGESGRDLAIYSVAAARAKRLAAVRRGEQAALSPEENAALAEYDSTNDTGFMRRLENTRRGVLVTQISTAMRNAVTQGANVSLGVMEDAMERELLRISPFAAHRARAQTLKPLEPLIRLANHVRLPGTGKSRTRNDADTILSMFPKEREAMFATISSDVANPAATRGQKAMSRLEQGVHVLNTFNRIQEYAFRRSMFTAKLDQILARDGRDLASEMKAGDLNLSREQVQEAVEASLDATWGKNYNPRNPKDGYERVAGSFIEFVNNMRSDKLPIALTQVIPYPRFMANAVEWQIKHSPASPDAWRMLYSPAGREALARGEIKPLMQAMTGTAMMYSAWKLRNSQQAGDKWYQVRVPGVEEPLDMRAYAPFSAYLFVADLAKRAQDGTPMPYDASDTMSALAGAQFRAGSGMYVLDQVVEAVQGQGNPDRAAEKAKTIAGEVAGSWLVPLMQVNHLMQAIDESASGGRSELGVIRDTSTAPFKATIQKRIPGIATDLPEAQLATRESPPYVERPLARFFGMTFSSVPSAAERELDQLGLTAGDILPGSGNREWDQLVKKHMGPLFEDRINRYVERPYYQKLPPAQRALKLKEKIGEVADRARSRAKRENRKLWEQVQEERRPKLERKAEAERIEQRESRRRRLEQRREMEQYR